MNVFEFVLGILLIVFVYKLLESRIRHRSAEAKEGASVDEARARLDALEERIRVLERIVTDERFDLKREFRNLD
jgi:uncharacterized membrane protein